MLHVHDFQSQEGKKYFHSYIKLLAERQKRLLIFHAKKIYSFVWTRKEKRLREMDGKYTPLTIQNTNGT